MILSEHFYSFDFILGQSKDCNNGLIIGGSLGGDFILIIVSGGSAIFIYLQVKIHCLQSFNWYLN